MSRFKGSVQVAQRRDSSGPSRPAVLADLELAPSTPPRAQSRISETQDLARLTTAASPFHRLAFYSLLALVFVRFSFLHEILAIKFGFRSHLPLVFGVPVVIGLILTGGLARTLRSRGTFFWIAFAIWLALATVASTWRGGSASLVSNYYQDDFVMIFAIAGLVATGRELVSVLYAIGAAGVVNELTMEWMGGLADNRLEGGVVTIGNSNDFAAHMLLILPVLWLVAARPQVPRALRAVMLATFAYAIFQICKTGSRGALVALLAMTLILFFRVSLTGKVFVIAGAGVAAAALAVLLPSAVFSRYMTLFEGDSSPSERSTVERENIRSEATASAVGRMSILGDSISFTLRNPLFGIGPGEFRDTNGFEAKAKGIGGGFVVTHNSYTQVSSEAGIPALVFFLAGCVSMFRATGSVVKRAREAGNRDLVRVASALLFSMVGFSTAAFFLSLAYQMYFPVLAGLAMACANVADHELRGRNRESAGSPGALSPVWSPSVASV